MIHLSQLIRRVHHLILCRVGIVLSRYKSGPLPKPFKIVPTLPAWARILALTKPEEWTPQACHAATRIFVSQMKPAQARVFLEGVLLDAIREDIRLTREGARKSKNHRKLNVHYYESLRRALYKPAAFFKGIVFPLLNVSGVLTVCELHPRLVTHGCVCSLVWMHITGSSDCGICPCESQGSRFALSRRPHSTREHGLHRCVPLTRQS